MLRSTRALRRPGRLAKTGGKRVDLALGIGAGAFDLRLLLLDLGAQRQVAGDAATDADRQAAAQEQRGGQAGALYAMMDQPLCGTPDLRGQLVTCVVYHVDIGHMSNV